MGHGFGQGFGTLHSSSYRAGARQFLLSFRSFGNPLLPTWLCLLTCKLATLMNVPQPADWGSLLAYRFCRKAVNPALACVVKRATIMYRANHQTLTMRPASSSDRSLPVNSPQDSVTSDSLATDLSSPTIADPYGASSSPNDLDPPQKRKRGRPRKHPVTPAKPKNGRSRTGCITCRKRKKKCDETRPQCKPTLAELFAIHDSITYQLRHELSAHEQSLRGICSARALEKWPS